MINPDDTKLEIRGGEILSPATLLISGGAILSFIHLYIRSVIPEDRLLLSGIMLCFGFSLFLIGVYCLQQKRIPNWVNSILNIPSKYLHISQNQFIAIFFAINLSITATISAGFEPFMYSPVVAVISWTVSILLIVIVGWGKNHIPIKLQNRELQFLICLFLVALALRAIDTTHYPNALSGDEASQGFFSSIFLEGLTDNIFIAGWFGFPSFFSLIQSVGIRFLGHTTPALRIPSAIIGAFTVVALYFVVKAIINRRAALISSLLLAFSHYHIHFSRIGLNNIWDGFFWVVTLGALWVAWNRESKGLFIFTGLSLGLSQYFYSSARGLFIIIPIWLILVGFQDKKKFRKTLPTIILMAISTVVVILPLAWFYVNKINEFLAPMNRVAIQEDWLIDQAILSGKTIPEIYFNLFTTSFLGLTSGPLNSWYDPGTGLLRPVSAGIFYFSSVILLFRIKDNRTWLTFLWLGFIVSAGALSLPVPAAQRYIAAIPVCVMIMGFGIDQIIQWSEKLLKNYGRIISTCLLILVLLLGVDDTWFYFYKYSPNRNFGGINTLIAQRLANTLQNYDSSWDVVFSGWPQMGYYSISSIRFLDPQIKGFEMVKPWGDPENPLPEQKNVLFVFLPVRDEDLKACMKQYPGGELKVEYMRDVKLYNLYKVRIP
jgi:hypothetical protein